MAATRRASVVLPTPDTPATSTRFGGTDNTGRAAIIRASAGDGTPLPFGAEVFDAEGNSVGTVAQAGRIIARGLKTDSGTLTARWGQDAKSSCSLGYALSAGDARSTSYATADAECR